MDNRMINNGNVILQHASIKEVSLYEGTNIDVKYDVWDSVVTSNRDNSVTAYWIYRDNNRLGFVALYNVDFTNKIAYIYGRIEGERYYSELIMAMQSLLQYAFNELHINKIHLAYRHDNYFYDDISKHLGFVREGLLKSQLHYKGKYIDVNVFAMLKYEYERLLTSEYKRMFAWDYSYNPHEVIQLNLNHLFNRRLFTNAIDNPNQAQINAEYSEFVLNPVVLDEQCLRYKNLVFPVSIFDMDSEFDSFACERQEIQVSNGRYKDVWLVTTAQFGYKDVYINAVYMDGTTENCQFTVGDWCDKIVRNEYVIYRAAACRNLGLRSNMVKCDACIYLQRIHLNPQKELCKLVFPDDHDIFVFAGALS